MSDTETFTEWTDFIEAHREGRLRWESGSSARVVYDSSYSDEPQTLEGEVDRTSDGLGKTFHLDGKAIEGFHVYSNSRKIGHVEEIEFEVRDR